MIGLTQMLVGEFIFKNWIQNMSESTLFEHRTINEFVSTTYYSSTRNVSLVKLTVDHWYTGYKVFNFYQMSNGFINY